MTEFRYKVVLRHMAYRAESDRQEATPQGELQAFAMGQQLYSESGISYFERATVSTSPRTKRCAEVIQGGFPWTPNMQGLGKTAVLHNNLSNWGSDERFTDEMERDMRKAMERSSQTPGQAVFSCDSTQELLEIKAAETKKVIDEVSAIYELGAVLFVLHGPTIDKVFELYMRELGRDEGKRDMDVFGRQIGTCEGFLLTCRGLKLVDIDKLEQPKWARDAVAAMP